MLLSTTIATPTHLVATNNGSIDVNLSWQDVSGAVGYIVEQAPAGTGRFVAVDQPMYANAYENDVQPTQRYDFRVRAVAQDGTVSAPSAIATVLVPLQPPEVSQVDVSSSVVSLSWYMAADDPPSSIEVDRSTDDVHYARVALLPPGTLQYFDTNLIEGTGYCYKSRAIDGPFSSDWTAPVGAISPPTSPVGLSARAVSTTEADLAWRNVSRNAQQVLVVRSDDGGANFNVIDSLSPSTSTYRDRGLVSNHKYMYYVESQIESPNSPLCPGMTGEDSDPSNTVTVTTPPPSVTGLSAKSVSTSEIDLSWTGAVRGATGIEVDVSTNGQTYHPAATLPASARSYRSTGLLSDTHYWYEVRALRPAGPGAFSPADAYTLVPAPVDLRARLDGFSHVQLTWRSNDPRGTVFKIERSEDPNNFPASSNTTTNTSYTDMFDPVCPQ